MKKDIIKYFFSALFSFMFFVNCSDENNFKIQNPFSVRISRELELDKADSLLAFLKTKIPDSLYLINDDDLFTVNVGYFASSSLAGAKGFRLYSDSLIQNYNIYYGDSAKVYDEFRYVPFLGEDLDRPALYKYDLVKKKKWLVWSKWGRKIINFTYPKNFSPAYFLTALSYGRKTGFPYITDVRAYKYNVVDNSVKRFEKLGTGLQVFSNYNQSWNYEVYFNILDSVNTSTVIQIKNEYSSNGEKESSEERHFHILEEGYPVPPSSLPQLISPGKNYYIKAEGTDEGISYYLNNYKKNKREFIFSSELELSKVNWSRNEDYFAVSLKNPGLPSEYSKLILFNTEEAQVINEFENNGAVSFIVHGDLLIFDSWNNNDSQIIIFNYRNQTLHGTISIPGGCGLNYIKSEYIGN